MHNEKLNILNFMIPFFPVSEFVTVFQSIERRAQPRRNTDRVLRHMDTLVACLEHVGDGVILIDSHLRVVHMTGTAHRLLETCKDHISVQNNQLIFTTPDKALHLRQFAKRAFSSDDDCGGGLLTRVGFFIPRSPQRN